MVKDRKRKREPQESQESQAEAYFSKLRELEKETGIVQHEPLQAEPLKEPIEQGDALYAPPKSPKADNQQEHLGVIKQWATELREFEKEVSELALDPAVGKFLAAIDGSNSHIKRIRDAMKHLNVEAFEGEQLRFLGYTLRPQKYEEWDIDGLVKAGHGNILLIPGVVTKVDTDSIIDLIRQGKQDIPYKEVFSFHKSMIKAEYRIEGPNVQKIKFKKKKK